MSLPQWLREWLPVDTLKVLIAHAIVTGTLIFLCKGLAMLATWALPVGFFREAVLKIDDFVVLALLVWFSWQMIVLLWKSRVRIFDGSEKLFMVA